MEKIMETLQAAVIEVLQCDISELLPETSFEKDLGNFGDSGASPYEYSGAICDWLCESRSGRRLAL